MTSYIMHEPLEFYCKLEVLVMISNSKSVIFQNYLLHFLKLQI